MQALINGQMVEVLTFQDVARADKYDDVWVFNTTQGETRGNVFFTVPDAHGKENSVTVFASGAPTKLTDQVPKEALLNSPSFRRALNTNMLALISNETATSILAQPGMEDEYERNKQLGVAEPIQNAQAGMGKQAEKSGAELSIPVTQFIDLMETRTDAECLVALQTLGQLDLTSYRAVMQRCKSLSYASTGKFVERALAALKS